MKVTVLGSAAAEGIPALWCECPLCGEAARRGGHDRRTRTAYRIGADTLVDFGPDIRTQLERDGGNGRDIRRILLTHSHCDHLNAFDLAWRRSPDFSRVSSMVRLFANAASLTAISERAFPTARVHSWEQLRLRAVKLPEGGGWIDDGDLRFLAIPACHAASEHAYNFVVESGGKRVLFANDTGWWGEASWRLIAGVRLEAAFIECTLGFQEFAPEEHPGHLNVTRCLAFLAELTRRGARTPETRLWINHFSHNGAGLHADYERFFAAHGAAPAYDGLTVSL